MYNSINLMFYSEKEISNKQKILSLFVEQNTPFKELNSLTLALNAIKNPHNYVVFMIKNEIFLQQIEAVSINCHNYQERVFVVYCSSDINDCFFTNSCTYHNLDPLKQFILHNATNKNIIPQHQSSKLLNKLIALELENLDISPKYVGFKYLIGVVTNALSNNFYSCNYIDLFHTVASTNSATIDTIERDVRHMLITTWKKSNKFRSSLQSVDSTIDKPKIKTILNAIITYLKNVI